MNTSAGKILCVCALALAIANNAHAAFTITVQQIGGSVVASGSGSINTAGLTFLSLSSVSAQITSLSGQIILGNSATSALYSGITGPTSFGTTPGSPASSSTGATIGVGGLFNQIFVPNGYVSGTSYSDNATWSGLTFSSLGLTAGTYTWNWGSGANTDFMTLNIVSVPEPSTAVLLAVSAIGMLIGYRRK